MGTRGPRGPQKRQVGQVQCLYCDYSPTTQCYNHLVLARPRSGTDQVCRRGPRKKIRGRGFGGGGGQDGAEEASKVTALVTQ